MFVELFCFKWLCKNFECKYYYFVVLKYFLKGLVWFDLFCLNDKWIFEVLFFKLSCLSCGVNDLVVIIKVCIGLRNG